MSNPHETVPLSAEQVRAAHDAIAAQAAPIIAAKNTETTFAATAPLPGPAADAFASDGMARICGIEVGPVTGGHIAVLTAINSPFLVGIRIASVLALAKTEEEKTAIKEKAKAAEITIEDVFEALFVLSHSPAHSRSILRLAKASFREVALEAVLDLTSPFPNLDFVAAQLGEHYARSFVTALNFEAAKAATGKGATINFPVRPSAMDSAGS